MQQCLKGIITMAAILLLTSLSRQFVFVCCSLAAPDETRPYLPVLIIPESSFFRLSYYTLLFPLRVCPVFAQCSQVDMLQIS